jgi:hypothetical protein
MEHYNNNIRFLSSAYKLEKFSFFFKTFPQLLTDEDLSSHLQNSERSSVVRFLIDVTELDTNMKTRKDEMDDIIKRVKESSL